MAKRPFEEVGEKQQRRRLSDFVATTSAHAKQENVSPTKLYAHGLTTKYLHNKKIAGNGKQILSNSPQDKHSHIPLQTASAIFVCGKMTKCVYTEIRLLLKEAGADVLPTYGNLDKFRKEHRPDVKELKPPYVGVKFDYEKALKLTAAWLFKSIDLPVLQNINEVH